MPGPASATNAAGTTGAAGAPATTVLILALLGTVLAPAPVAAQDPFARIRESLGVVNPLVDTAEDRVEASAEVDREIQDAVLEGILAENAEEAEAAWDRAVHMTRVLVASNPQDPDAHVHLAVALGYRLEVSGTREKIRLGGESRREAELALTLEPEHAGAHQVMGRLNAAVMRMGRISRFVARRFLGAEMMEGVSWEGAEYHFRTARDLEPTNPRHSMEFGVLYVDTGRKALGVTELRRAINGTVRGPSDSLAVARAAGVLASMEEK